MKFFEFALSRGPILAIASVIAGLGLAMSLGMAVAKNDDGAKTFFQEDSAPRQVSGVSSEPRTLTIRRSEYSVAHSGRVRSRTAVAVHIKRDRSHTTRLALQRPEMGPTRPVTLFTDTTLVRGDAVMTLKGIRIFAGSKYFPYSAADFVALEQMTGLSKQTKTLLFALNSLPHV